MKHIVQEVLIGGGMFTNRGRTFKPLERFEGLLQCVWWPATVGHISKTVLLVFLSLFFSLFTCTQIAGTAKADQW